MSRLDDKVAVVFGAGPNIGGTIAHFMAKEGAKVVVNDLAPAAADETVQFLTSRGYEAIAVPGDATKEEDVNRIFGEAAKRYGHVDSVVNLAGSVVWGDVTKYDSRGLQQVRAELSLRRLPDHQVRSPRHD